MKKAIICFLPVLTCSFLFSQSYNISLQRKFPLKKLPSFPVKVNKSCLSLWVMNNDARRTEGMMFLQDFEVKPNQGMLFVFPSAKPRAFWMRNTFIPMDAVFIGANKRVLNISPLKPFDETPVKSKGAAKYVIELKMGTSAKIGLKPGVLVNIPDKIKSADIVE
jgi:uncharacterized membrane protein (UPF0127 family)